MNSSNPSDRSTQNNDDIVLMPVVRPLSFADLRICLKQGISDFTHAPAYGLFFGGVFVFIGLFIVQSLFVWEKTWLMYPMLIGFPLIGPFAAVGLYEVSRRRQAGEPLVWNKVLGVVRDQSSREIRWMAFVLLFIFWIWMYQIRLLIALILGRMSFGTLGEFFNIVTGTPEGILFILIGHVVGAFFALLLFSTTVISFPLLLEREVDFITAMITSFKTVIASPFVMLTWGVFVTLAVMASFIPAFLGLLVVLPVLGHTTWHIYKKAVVEQTNAAAA
ncbi:MAG: DUF2189 domain-containing protein [Gammaproteobacteria bacterium]